MRDYSVRCVTRRCSGRKASTDCLGSAQALRCFVRKATDIDRSDLPTCYEPPEKIARPGIPDASTQQRRDGRSGMRRRCRKLRSDCPKASPLRQSEFGPPLRLCRPPVACGAGSGTTLASFGVILFFVRFVPVIPKRSRTINHLRILSFRKLFVFLAVRPGLTLPCWATPNAPASSRARRASSVCR